MAHSLLLVIFIGWFFPFAMGFKIKDSVTPPSDWIPYGIPPPNHTIELQIALRQSNFDLLETHLHEISNPFHERYGEHLSKAEVEDLIRPHPATLDAVGGWLATYAIREEHLSRSPGNDWITVNLPVSTVEDMLNTRYQLWKHREHDNYIVGTLNYSLPEHLHEHIDVIQPTTMFARGRMFRSTVHVQQDDSQALSPSLGGNIVDPVSGLVVDARCNVTITLDCLKQLYNVTAYTPTVCPDNHIGITGYLEQYANLQDYWTFQKDQVPGAPQNNFSVELVNGGENSQDPLQAGAEANLDVQFAFGLASPIPGTFYSTAGRPPFKADNITIKNTNEPYADWLNYMLKQDVLPQVISTSYGDDEQTVPEDYARRVCKGFAQLGTLFELFLILHIIDVYARGSQNLKLHKPTRLGLLVLATPCVYVGVRGVSVIFSSGDGGVGVSGPASQCVSNDGKGTPKFIPVFPASCPYVTSVGGTYRIPEVGVGFSGGGFSDYFPRPGYQKQVVESFLKTLPNGTYAGLYNRTGRGIPDVSAQSYNFRVYIGGQSVLIGGTSASAPAFAGVVALLNDVKLSAGRKSLGWLNPWLYLVGHQGFKDIIAGHAPGCGTPGFDATVGWDPVTGLGTPDFGKLKDLVMSC